ncbi:hypothetical protein [Ralstonia solanacearum]|uniref:hypothetical protein n=1 Tax=Ralstonia solanacearum TaxID=305 RepID=UPI0005AC9BA5|nr:hypothetical protein [Ralstonia solanacearum]MDC6177111.1 hypothetical protein [Ralstonia solanacearum]MDC6238357.1 hypothetical protein [Ralstonia solanacearum]
MILYPAGPEWARCFEVDMPATELAARLVSKHEFTRAMLFQPFGHGRGAVITTRGHMLVMAVETDGQRTIFTVAPTVQMQNLLWSLSNGYTSQWSETELKILTGCSNFRDVLELARTQFAAALRSFERALAGKPEVDVVITHDDSHDVLEIPSDYYVTGFGSEGAPCDLSN